MDIEAFTSNAQLLKAALVGPPQEAFHPEPDAMEDEQHDHIHVGTYPPLACPQIRPLLPPIALKTHKS
jgi:hypothetical protein